VAILFLCLVLALNCANAQVTQTTPSDHFTELSLEQLLDAKVETAALKKQSLNDAPADVTIITAADIRRYGYRTLGEALSNVRGFYMTHDGGFQFAGVRGFSLLGDYNTRFLVMINGHQMTDNVYSAMYMFGQDFGLDMDLVEQIEIVRGPSSALYGSNGLFSTINIITKKPAQQQSGYTSAEVGSFGETKAVGSATFRFGRTGRGLISGSMFRTDGRTASLDAPGNVDPITVGDLGKEQGYHSFAALSWNRWSFTGMFGERRISVPTGFYGADVGDAGTRSLEARNFIEVAWHRPLGRDKALKWRAYYDQYRYDGIYNYYQSFGSQSFDGAVGDWIGNQLLYQQEHTRIGAITVGAEANVDIRNLQYGYSMVPTSSGAERQDDFLLRHPNASYALFVQDEWRPAPKWTIYFGGRFDDSRNNRASFSPRAAVVHKMGTSTYKLMYGRAFRNPSTFERYWSPSPSLGSEQIQSIELSREQKLGKRLNLLTSAFHYRLSGLIQGVPITDNILQYQNRSKAAATGLEFELNGRPFDRLDTSMSYTLHRVRGAEEAGRLENSPARLAHFRAAIPFAQERMVVAGAMRHVSSRLTAFADLTPAATVFDLTGTVRFANKQADLQFGVRNLFDRQYADPLSAEHSTTVLPRTGRAIYVKLSWRGE
jgi:outer membrane receptor for ferrienterochelin and colicins